MRSEEVLTKTITLEQLYLIFHKIALTDTKLENFPITLSWADQEEQVSLPMFFHVLQKEVFTHRSWCGSNLN